MAGKISAGMLAARDEAKRLINKGGFKPSQINYAFLAGQFGVTANSIYRSAWYKELKAAQK